MSINFAQIPVSLADLVDNPLPIIRGKLMEFHEIWERDLQKKQFQRLVDAFEAAERHELHRTAIMLMNRLQGLGAWVDDLGDWHDETRPNKPIDDPDGADMAAGWEV